MECHRRASSGQPDVRGVLGIWRDFETRRPAGELVGKAMVHVAMMRLVRSDDQDHVA